MLEVEVVVIGKTHTSEYDLVHVGTQGHLGHHIIVWLVGVREERNLLSGHESVVEVDAGYARRDDLARLTSLVRVHGRTAYLSDFALHLRTAVDRMSVCVEEASGKPLAHLQHRRLAEESDGCIGRDAFGSGENLERYQIALGLDDLRKSAVHNGKLIVGHTLRAQGNRSLGDGFQLCVCFLICLICHCSGYF